MHWRKLSMAKRAQYIKLALENGITDLNTVRQTYNEYAQGGTVNKFDDGGKKYQLNVRGLSNNDILETLSFSTPEERQAYKDDLLSGDDYLLSAGTLAPLVVTPNGSYRQEDIPTTNAYNIPTSNEYSRNFVLNRANTLSNLSNAVNTKQSDEAVESRVGWLI